MSGTGDRFPRRGDDSVLDDSVLDDPVLDNRVPDDRAPSGRSRLAGLSPGAGAFVAVWIVGAAIARLTGAAAVILLLAAGLVALVAAAISGFVAVRRCRVFEVVIPTLATVGAPVPVSVSIEAPADVVRRTGSVRLFADAFRRDPLATIRLAALARLDTAPEPDPAGGRYVATASVEFTEPGIFDQLTVDVATAGAAGLVWFRRTVTVPVAPVHVAPHASGPPLPVVTASTTMDGTNDSRHGPRHGDIDGVRPWRNGEGDAAVHWPSTLRAGSLIVHDRVAATDRSWTVEVPPRARTDAYGGRRSGESNQIDDSVAARLHFTVLDGLRQGHVVAVRTADLEDSDAPVPVTNTVDAHLMAARHVGRRRRPPPRQVSILRRELRMRTALEDDVSVRPRARWATAFASLVAFGMLLGSLDSGPFVVALVALGLAAGAATSVFVSERCDTRPVALQVAVMLATVGALGFVAMSLGGLSGLLAALRGPMPDLLMMLGIIHGFEVVDRRTLRVHQAIGAVVVAYATGLRIDDRVGWWLAAWGLAIVAAVRSTTAATAPSTTSTDASAGSAATGAGAARSSVPPRLGRRALRVATSVVVATMATFGVLALVPVPDGPAQLGLPALTNDARPVSTPGALAGADGNAPGRGDGTRGSLGTSAGYPGFSETLDTSVRGDLGDEIMMRVRAPEAAFWRGQTFPTFDGRTWTVAADTGTPQRGPRIDVPLSLGDGALPGSDVPVERFVQTFYIESDLPNVVFAASTPRSLMFDGTVWTRPDGALRSNVTLTEGSVYTVASERVQVTADALRRQGDIAQFFAAISDPGILERIAPFLDVPASTTPRTVELADRLRAGTTYDTVLAYQAWLANNTAYDLDAPVPAPGADAVDDFLFESRRGFCEQIASTLAIMLRTQGVPARLATGYIPGVRDRVSGVFEVRASDAHAWVEVWFPETGWEPFDPTASVPLAGDARQGSVGGELIAATMSMLARHPVEIGVLIAVAIALLAVVRYSAAFAHRRRRGRWGLLQDRFRSLDGGRSAAAAPTNPAIAGAFATTPCDDDARQLAEVLDRVAFDPSWDDDDDLYERAAGRLRRLERCETRQAPVAVSASRCAPATRRAARRTTVDACSRAAG